MSEPIVSVIVVSDYAGGSAGSIDDYRHCLRALAAQDFDEPVEFLGGQKARVLWRELANRIPPLRVDRNDALATQAVDTALQEVLEQDKDPAAALSAQRKYIERLIWSGRAR